MYKISLFAASLVLLLPLLSHAFASNIEIDIQPGSSKQNQSLTFYPPFSTAYVGDTVEFANHDNVTHEIVSGTPSIGTDGKFDSGTINPGQYAYYTFTEYDVGTFVFFDQSYPWMVEKMSVQEPPAGYKVIHGVGAGSGDGQTTYDVQYQSVKNIVSANIGLRDKSLNLLLVGHTSQDTNLILNLPTGLISPPFRGVQLDGQFITNYTETNESGMTVLTIPITPVTEQVSIIGTQVVPEFGPVAYLVLLISIITTVLLTRIMPARRPV